jgi:ATP-dependent Clp protease ATP-binding subunit ClpB
MRLEQLTIKAQEAVLESQRVAESLGNQQVEPEHLLKALLDQSEGLVRPLLQKLEVDLGLLSTRLTAELTKIHKVTPLQGNVYVSFRLKQVFDNARLEAEKLKDDYVRHRASFVVAGGRQGRAGLAAFTGIGSLQGEHPQALQQVRGTTVSPTRIPRRNTNRFPEFGAT